MHNNRGNLDVVVLKRYIYILRTLWRNKENENPHEF